jgi:CRP-like cAMP-binding protein
MPRTAPSCISTKPMTISPHPIESRRARGRSPTLGLSHTDQQELTVHARITRYGADEVMQTSGEVPTRMSFIVKGRVRLVATTEDGSVVPVSTLEEGAFLGQTTATRHRVSAGAYALGEVAFLQLDREHIEEPLLLQEIGRAIEERRANVTRALAAVGD